MPTVHVLSFTACLLLPVCHSFHCAACLILPAFASKLQAKFQLDGVGDVDGITVVSGVGWETASALQIQQDTGQQIHVSGDGTVTASIAHIRRQRDTH